MGQSSFNPNIKQKKPNNHKKPQNKKPETRTGQEKTPKTS